ncbi:MULTISPECIES: S8 family peptidase [unclassified Pseudoxanthomonas]|uniref:S8 family peptidase n=1 Tax=unclassified Pseudoxanthomonas TaxID=2645906 RepID=UPI0016074AB4|nr:MULTISPECIES: S8 family peptidase [unclassified Pseudoxanthomonas]MBB3276860.1 serine protease [Pseudoxanthomonas sp. OG2]MBD9376839.1 S8 family serine peptidase [Pseudoxanthomonas sp. PXM04]MBV7475848.1 S8 family serine peptidase [Pseudoxanthomonas sp. PXM05]
MKKSTRIICTGTLATAVVAALSAFASGYLTGGTPWPPAGLSTLATTASTSGGAMQGPAVPGASTASRGKSMLPGAPAQSGFDRFIVRQRDGARAVLSGASVRDAVQAAARRAGVAGPRASARGAAALDVQHLRRMASGADVVRLSRKLSRGEADALLAELRADPAVKYAQPDYIKHRLDFIPDDPRFDLQWHYTHPTAGIGMPAAWDLSHGDGVVVAVLDTGYLDHADLNANIVPGYDFVHDPEVGGDGDGRDPDAHDPGDWYGGDPSSFHGTHVAGTVAATTNNGAGLAGVAFGAKVQPVRVLGHGGGYTSDISDAIVWASGGHVDGVPDNSDPAEVVNLSLGGSGSCSQDPATQEAIDGAVARGVTVVVAAGNDDADAGFYSPASCKGVITVGANGIDGARSWFSNYGASVTVTAPGGNATSGSDPDDRWIWSLGNAGTQAPVPSPEGDRLMGMIGTSMASPHVAGVVALMQAAANAAGRPPLTPEQVKQLLKGTVKPFTVPPPVSKPQGPGIVDATAAVQAATQEIPEDEGELLSNRVALTAQTGAAGDSLLYRIVVPAGRTSLNLRSYGGSGDVSIYVARERVPTTTLYDRKSVKPGNSEAVLITNPAPGTYYLRVVGETAFGGVSVMGLY